MPASPCWHTTSHTFERLLQHIHESPAEHIQHSKVDQELLESAHTTALAEVAQEVLREPPPNADTVFQLFSHPVQDKDVNTYSHGVDYLTACAEEYNLASLLKQNPKDPLPHFISPALPCSTLNTGSWLPGPWGEDSVKGCQWQEDWL